MKLTSLLAGALLVCGLNAAPVADVADIADGAEVSEVRDVAGELFARSGQLCRIVGTKTVNCRTGPGTNYKSKVSLSSSWTRGYYFTCVKSGQCVTINGAKNWYVPTRASNDGILARQTTNYLTVGGTTLRRTDAMSAATIPTVAALWVRTT